MSLFDEFQKDLMGLEDSGAGLPFVFTPTQAFTLLGMLQLVLRHPKVQPGSGPASEFAQGLAEEIIERLCITEAMREVARQGWHQDYDLPQEKP